MNNMNFDDRLKNKEREGADYISQANEKDYYTKRGVNENLLYKMYIKA